jgi:hypothetical protein
MVLSPQHFSDITNGYERMTSGLWTHKGKLVVVGQVVLPTGSITTDEIAADAVQQRVASYAQGVGWTLPSSNVWTETPVQVTLSLGGWLCRFEFNVLLGCPTKGQRIFWSIMTDGAVPPAPLGAMDAPENNFGVMASGVYYAAPASGERRLAFGVYGPSGSQIYSALPSTLYVTEQKR